MLLRLALLAFALTALGADALAASPDGNARLAELLEGIRATSGVPALAASVVSSRGALATAAVGHVAADDPTPVTTNSRFHLGSAGRVMTGVLAAVLGGRGDIRVSGAALLRRSELDANAAWNGLTLADLLAHRAGLPAWMPVDDALRARLGALPSAPMEQRRAAVRELLAAPPAQPIPTPAPMPSAAGYVVAGHLLEADARKPYEALVERDVFGALGLRGCELGGPSGAGDAQPHVANGGVARATNVPEPLPVLAPAGGVSCSVRDLARLAGAHLRGLALAGKPERTVVVRKDARIVALRNTLGWTLDRTGAGRDVYTMIGGDAHYTTLIALFPDDDRALVVVANVGEQPLGKPLVVKATQAIRNRYGF